MILDNNDNDVEINSPVSNSIPREPKGKKGAVPDDDSIYDILEEGRGFRIYKFMVKLVGVVLVVGFIVLGYLMFQKADEEEKTAASGNVEQVKSDIKAGIESGLQKGEEVAGDIKQEIETTAGNIEDIDSDFDNVPTDSPDTVEHQITTNITNDIAGFDEEGDSKASDGLTSHNMQESQDMNSSLRNIDDKLTELIETIKQQNTSASATVSGGSTSITTSGGAQVPCDGGKIELKRVSNAEAVSIDGNLVSLLIKDRNKEKGIRKKIVIIDYCNSRVISEIFLQPDFDW